MSETAGQRLAAALESAKLHASRMQNAQLEWTEQETEIIARAVSTADRAEQMRAVFDAELAGEAQPAVLAKLSAELRALDKLVVDLVGQVNPDVGPVKSERHQRAARSRWDRKHGQAG